MKRKGKISQFTIFSLQSTIGCFVNVRKKLLISQMKSRNLINREGFSRISSQLAIYEEVENWKCFENCAPHEGREYLTTISDSLSCAVVISWLNPSIKIIVTIWVPLTAVPTNSFKFAGVSGHGGKPNAYEPIRLQDLGIWTSQWGSYIIMYYM